MQTVLKTRLSKDSVPQLAHVLFTAPFQELDCLFQTSIRNDSIDKFIQSGINHSEHSIFALSIRL